MLNCSMTWESKKARWRKLYKGKMYTISCTTLGTEPNKVASYKAANEWWSKKRAEIDGQVTAPEHPHQWLMEQLTERMAWAQGQGEQKMATSIKQNIDLLQEDKEGQIEPSIDVPLLGDQTNRAIWSERLGTKKQSPIPVDRTVAGQVGRWVDLQKARAEAGEIVPAEAENRRHAITFFETWVGRDLTLDHITESKWTDYYTYLLKQMAGGDLSRSYCEKLLRYARQFVDFLDDERLLTPPKNLHKLRIKQKTRSISIMPVEDVRKLIETAKGPLRLHLLLMANCAFTQQDISDLKPSELRNGCIVRKRSKTKDEDDVPEVRYRLWPETLSLLEKDRSSETERLLVTKSRQPWVRKEFQAGKFVECDSIRTLYSRHARRQGVGMSMKYIRKTSATLIDRETKRFDERIATLFLGHSPRSIKDRHYSRPADEILDEALEWLRGQYFPEVK